MLSVSLLGGFSIANDGVPVEGMDSARLRSLLAYLLLHADTPQPRAHLAYLFWPDTTEAQAHTNLRNLLYRLRHVLPDLGVYLDIGVHTLQWRREAPCTLDVDAFWAAVAAAQGLPAAAGARLEALERAVSLYCGDLLPDCYDDWVISLREGLGQAYVQALDALATLLESQANYGDAIRHGRALLRHDPLAESGYRRLIRLHALNGDRASALRVYHDCATILQRELGVEPAAATREAYERLLGTPDRWPVPGATAAYTRLVGRQREWSLLLQSWRGVASGNGARFVLLSGEAGIGKTRLVEELLSWTGRQGIACASAHCYAAEGELAYAPVRACLRDRPVAALDDVWLAELSRLLPELRAGRPSLAPLPPLREAWQRQHLFEALARGILGDGGPLLLALDDLQWCDRDTLEWLHFLLRFASDARVLLVGTYRPEEVGTEHPLVRMQEALRAEDKLTEVELAPLDEAATGALAGDIAGDALSPDQARLLFRETEGVPLFVVETMRAGLPIGGSPRDVPRDDVGLPARVRSVLEARLAQLSPATRELADLAATVGRDFSFRLLATASGRDEETIVRQLDELWRRRIVRERGTDAYSFSHDKLREVAYASMSAARRRLLHRHAAQALETLHLDDLDPVSYQLAVHYELAGLRERAIHCFLLAGRVASRVYAHDDAVALLERGLSLAQALNDREPVCPDIAALWEELGDIRELGARHEEAREVYERARSVTLAGQRVTLARLWRKAAVTWREQRRYAEALDACRRAEDLLQAPPSTEDADWWAEWLEVQVERVWAHYWLAQWEAMDALVIGLEPAVRARATGASRMRYLTASCLMNLRKGRYRVTDEMLANSRESLSLAETYGRTVNRIESRFELGFLHLWRLELDAAGEHLHSALALAETAGAVPMRVLSLTYLTVLCRFRGDADGTRDYAQRAGEAAAAARMDDYVAASLANRAWLAWRRGDARSAEALGRQALALWQQSPLVYPAQWQGLLPLIAIACAQKRYAQAFAWLAALLDPTQQLLQEPLNALLQCALDAHAAGQDGEARDHLQRAFGVARKLGYL